MMTDIEIARSIEMRPIGEVAEMMGVPQERIEPYGRYVAKLPLDLIDEKKIAGSKLILVTSISSTKTGIGKTTVSVGLSLGLNKIGKKAVTALREPSLGPCFGMKGGAAGGGYAQVLPMEKINLHFTGDFHAVTSANNMISALLDNYIYQHQEDGFGLKQILWKRVLDVNDRSLRHIVTGIGPYTNGVLQESGFDITPASEIMAILCLATDIDDLRRRVENILLGYTFNNTPFTVKELGIAGSVVTLLLDAIKPNLVQTTEGTPALIHGGPFANIAHGCNSVIATKMAMSYGDYVITEAGFGADLGAEKFFDIKCRKAGLSPALTILVATLRGLKMHGGVALEDISKPSAEGVRKGFKNMDVHIRNLQSFGQSVLVCFNKFGDDSAEEIAMVRAHCAEMGVPFALNEAFARGGEGAVDLANLVVETIEKNPSQPLRFQYADEQTVVEKIEAVAKNIYHAATVNFTPDAKKILLRLVADGYGQFPVCIAKTQYSFTQNPKAYGAPKGFVFDIKNIVINAGAEMIVAIAGDIIRMPGLPKSPQAERIDCVNGDITGLS